MRSASVTKSEERSRLAGPKPLVDELGQPAWSRTVEIEVTLTVAVQRPDWPPNCAGRQRRTRHLAGSGPAARLGGSFFAARR